MAVKRGGLGKGLDSLIPDHKPKASVNKEKASESAAKKEKAEMQPYCSEQKVKITKVEPNHTQPRKNFDEDSLIELADSIRQFRNTSAASCYEKR